MKEGFANLVNGKSQEVDLIIDSMFHSKKNEARRFLMFVNGIIDYYLHRKCDEEEGVCFPVVYLPNVPDWGREVLLKFLILKLSLFYNVQKREQLARRRGEVRLVNEEQNVHYKRYEGPFRRYIRPILKQLPQTYIGKDGHKNIIVCREQDLMTSRMDKNMFIKEFYGPVDDICSDDNLAICHDITAKDIREKLHSLKEDDKPKIDNIFIFYTNNEQCNSYNDAAIKRINVGVRNCFIFYFSSDPFRLYHTRKRKISLGGKFPMLPEKEALANEHFITLTEEESRYLFNLTTECCHCHIPDDQLFFHDQIETLFENSDHPILDRTHLTLCLDEVQRAEYIKLLKKLYPHYPYDIYISSIDYQIEFANGYVLPEIEEFLKDASKVAIILPYDCTKSEKAMFKRLIDKDIRISFHNPSALKDTKKNKIKESHIINFVYRPHYTDRPYHKYPNSFDPYYLNDNQHIIDIINGFAFEDRYLWDKYDYDKACYYLLKSKYRKELWSLPDIPAKPTFERTDEYDDYDREDFRMSPVISYKVLFTDGSKISIQENELVIVSTEADKNICAMKELSNENCTNISLQKLDEVIENALEPFLKRKEKWADSKERFIRESLYKQGRISMDECNSGIYLWKILLCHKIERSDNDTVYHEIMSEIKERDRIRKNAFKSWYDPESQMILPRNRVCQKRLIEYLGLDKTPYLAIMRSVKRSQRKGTRQSNSMKETFMLDFLFQEIDNDKFEKFTESNINDILMIQNIEELKALMSLIEGGIKVKIVKEITK